MFDPVQSEADAALLELGQALRAAGYRHVTVTPATHERVLRRRPGAGEGASASTLADVFGWSRPFTAADLPPDFPPQLPDLMRRAGVLRADAGRASSLSLSLVRASTLGENLYFHSAYPTDDENAVFFGPDTYRFVRALRAELSAHFTGATIGRAADIGCGAGPAAITIALHAPRAEVLALDINDDALRMTGVNAALAGAANLRAFNSDLLKAVDGQFDLIVANPPYLLDPGERAYRHGGGELGAGLSVDIVQAALGRLAPGGRLLVYTGVAIVDGVDPFLARITPLLDAFGARWDYEEIDPDVFGEELDGPEYSPEHGVDRIAAVWLRAQRPPG
ncbi:MAG: SAM-dependent methyltransferase [Massilia sp.]|nr:SAM-dependent methyltransferase [Massilia sp.]